MSDDRPRVRIFTDGACSPNPGKGGWGVVLESVGSGAKKELSGAEAATTNNRMELMAAVMGLKALKRPCDVELVTDSQYLANAFKQGWLKNWKKNGWKTKTKEPVKNVDLWTELDRLASEHAVTWTWVLGHNGHPENERADRLAVAARESLR